MRTVAIEHVSQNLYTEWLDLLKASPTASPFSYPSLLTDCDQAATVRESGELIALAPLCTEVRRGIKHLHFGNMDYSDVILKDPRDKSSVTELFEYLVEHKSELCDLIDIRGLTLSSNIQPKPGALTFGNVKAKAFVHQRYPKIENLTTFDEYLSRLHKKTAWQLQYEQRNISRKVSNFNILRVQEDNVHKMVQDLLIVNQIRWRSRGQSGITEEQLYTLWAQELFNHDRLYLEVAYSGNQPIAAIMCVNSDESSMYIAGGFDTKYSKFSPGKVMILRAIQECCNRNLKIFDFLRGLEPYKLKWGCTLVPTYRLIVGNKGLKGRLAATVLEFESKRKDRRTMERFKV